MREKKLQTKLRSYSNRLENAGEKPSVIWLVWGLYTLIIIVFAFRHEPWHDEYHVYGMVNEMDFLQLWKAMRVEGHFILWHLCLWPFVKWFGMDWHSLYCLSVPLMSLAAWLLLFKVKFPFIGKLLVVFSAPFFYFYPVISRCYALIPPILMGLAVLYQQKKHPFLYCILIGLLSNTHVYVEGLVAILWCCFVYHYVWMIWKESPQRARRNAYAASITLVFVMFAFAQVALGLYDVSCGRFPHGEGINTPEKWIQIFYDGYCINAFQWLKRHASFIPNLDLLLTLCTYVLIITCTHKVFFSYGSHKKEALFVLFCAFAWQILFATNIYGMNWQRIGLLYFSLLFVWLMYYKTGTRKKYLCFALLCCWILNTSSQLWIVKDLWELYDPSVKIAEEIKNDLPDNCSLNVERAGIRNLLNVKVDYWWPELIEDCKNAEHVDYWWLLLDNKNLEIPGCKVTYVNNYSYESYDYLNGRNQGVSFHLFHIEK